MSDGSERTRRRPAYANVVASVALFISLAGGAYAASTAPKNSVTSKSVKKDALKGVDINESTLGQVPSAAGVADNSVDSASVVNDSLGGSDIDESALSITAASVADNALGGADVDESSLQLPATPDEARPVFLRQPPNTAAFATVFEAHGLRVEGQCANALGELSLQFDHEEGLLMIENQFSGGGAPTVNTFGSAVDNNNPIGTGANGTAHITLNWRRASTGRTVNLGLTATNLNTAVGLDCAYFGTALAEN